MALTLRQAASIPVALSLLAKGTRAPLDTTGQNGFSLKITPGKSVPSPATAIALTSSTTPALTLTSNVISFRSVPGMFALGLWSWEAVITFVDGRVFVSDPGDLLIEA